MNLFRFQKSKKKKISEVKNFKKGRNPQGSMEQLPPPPPRSLISVEQCTNVQSNYKFKHLFVFQAFQYVFMTTKIILHGLTINIRYKCTSLRTKTLQNTL